MSLSNDPVEAAIKPSPGAAAEPSRFAPKRVRDGNGAARKVVSLRLPAAPQLVPVDSSAAARRPTGPELLAEDEVLKRLLQRHPDAKPLAVKPTRDPVGIALGMVARLIVAGCAAAGVVLLLAGVVPLPFQLGARIAGETATSAAPVAPVALGVPAAPVAKTASVAAAPPITVAAAPSVAAPPPATPVTTVSIVRAGAPAPTDARALDAGEVERLVKRGEDYLAQGDIAAARLILGRAAEARDPRAALSLGATYDPAVLRKLRVVGFKPDVAQARAWYEKAAGFGSSEAAARLAALPGVDP